MSRNLDRWVRQMRDEMASLSVPQAIEDSFGPYRDDPVGFCQSVLGVTSATRRSDGTSYQFAILADLAVHARV